MEESDRVREGIATDVGIITTDEDLTTVVNQTRLAPKNAIQIPPALGKINKERLDRVTTVYERFHKDWRAVTDAFIHTGSYNDYQQLGYARDNFIRDTVRTLLDYTYMQNPTAEFNTTVAAQQPFAAALSELITKAVNRSTGLGIDLRPHMLHTIFLAHMTNYGILKLQYTPERSSREDAAMLFDKIQQKLHRKQEEQDDSPDSAEEVETLLALLDRLYEEMNNRETFGLSMKSVNPFRFFVDPDCQMEDFSDAKYTMEIEFLSDNYIKANYMMYEEDEEGVASWKFRYNPSVTYDVSQQKVTETKDLKESIINEIMPDDDETRSKEEQDKIACVWVYDRILRKAILYIHGQWDTPLWVYPDEMELSRFFPYFLLSFGPKARGVLRYSEATYYIGFQEDVNDVNRVWTTAKKAAAGLYLYNSRRVDKEEVDKVLKEVEQAGRSNKTGFKAIGVKLSSNEGQISDIITPFLLPTAQVEATLDSNRAEQSLQRASRLSTAMSGGEFRTNTTNEAVETYQEQTQARVQAFNDPIENVSAQIMWSIAEVLVSKVPPEHLTTLVSEQHAAAITNMPVVEFNNTFAITIEAGSTEKANSQNKKKEATQIIQLLGQFGTAAPRTVLSIVTKLLRNVFSRNLVSDKDLEVLDQEGQAAMQKGISAQGGQPGQPQPDQTPSQGAQ